MKKSILYLACILSIVLTFTACETDKPDFFDKNANGAYFDYEYATDFDNTLNFGNYIVGNPDTVTMKFRVRLLGYLMDNERTLAVKTREIEGYEPADVAIQQVVFANKEYVKDIIVKVKRPEHQDKIYATCIYLDGSGDIGTGIEGKNEINLYVTESYEQPAVWYSHIETNLGSWSKEKHIFLANLTGNDSFYSNLYDDNLGTHIFDSIVALNERAVNALLANAPDEDITIDIPILKETDYPNYNEPYFWSDYEQLLGIFRSNKFCRFTNMIGGSNTRDIATLYAGEEAAQRMIAEADNFHKDDVLEMLNRYYQYALTETPIAEYKNLFWVVLKNNVNYNVRIPFWWEDPNNWGTGEIVKKYFGEYQSDKYQFMLKTMLKEDGAENFITASIIPFIYDTEKGTYAWDKSPFGKKQLSGEERLKECYRIIKAANDKRPEQRKFDIPDVPLQ